MYLDTDEFAMFSIAAHFAGLDWGDIASQNAYYSYGYAVLLIPLFHLFENMTDIYRAALTLNAVFAALVVPVAYYLLRQWGLRDIKEDKTVVLFLVFASVTVCSLSYTILGWGETLLILLAWVNTALIYKLQKNGTKTFWFALSGFLLVYMYMIHMRSLGVLAAGVIAVSLMKVFGKIGRKNFVVFLAAVSVFFLLSFYIKAYMQEVVWLSKLSNINDYGGQLEKIKFLFTPEGLYETFRVFVGQTFYIGLASGLLVYLAVADLVKYHIKNGKKDFDFALTFLLLGFLFTFIISVIFMNRPKRLDHVVYGRYNDIMYNILSLYILAKLRFVKKRTAAAVLAAFTLVSLAAIRFIRVYYLDNLRGLQKHSALMIDTIWDTHIALKDIMQYAPVFYALLVFVLFMIPFISRKKSKSFLALPIILSICFGYAQFSQFNQILASMDKSHDGLESLTKSAVGLPVYAPLGDYNYGYIQMYMKDTPLRGVNFDEIEDGEYYLFSNLASYGDLFTYALKNNTKLEIIGSNSNFYLYKGSKAEYASIPMPRICFILGGLGDTTKAGTTREYIAPNSVVIPAGDYSIDVDLEIGGGASGDFGKVEFTSKGLVFANAAIDSPKFTIPVHLDRDITPFTFTIHANENIKFNQLLFLRKK
ncbi:hypothetical protein AGMMS49975_07870 [Clostridia bacterium]|nr:hypothetical protein AGMMS49975_07870 [Clostridia bacterium]